MKKIAVTLLVVCLLFIAGCGKETPTPVPSATSQPTSSSTTQAPASAVQKQESAAASAAALQQRRTVALKALGDVLGNKTQFYSIDSARKLYLKDIKGTDMSSAFQSEDVITFKMPKFAVVDMDGDGVPEVVVELDYGSDGGFEVLHYKKDKVIGAYFVLRGMQCLSKNGLFNGTGGAAYNYTEKIRFLGDSYDISDQITQEDSSYCYHDVPVSENTYKVGGIPVLENNQVDWHAYTDAQIAKWVTNRPTSADPKPALSNDALVARQNYLDGLVHNSALKDPRDGDSYDGAGTIGQYDLMRGYYQAWDKELNKIYGLLEKKLSADQMDALRKDEKQWITIRDERGLTVRKAWTNSFGSYNAESADREQDIGLALATKNRTFYLIDRYFGDTSQPTTTEIIQKYGLKK